MKLDTITKTKLTTKPISISFNQLSEKDIDSVFLIESQSSKHPWTKNQLLESINNPVNLGYALIYKSEIIGFLLAMPSIESADILNIVINSNYQRKGFGRALIERLIEALLKRGVSEILLEVRVSNVSAIEFYLSLGFKEISVRKNYYTKNSNELSVKEDGIIMRLEISTFINS